MKHTATIVRILPSFEKIGPVQGTLSTVSYMDATHYQTMVAVLNTVGWGKHVQNAVSLEDEFEDANIPTYNLHLRKSTELFLALPRLFDLIDTINPDIVHTQLLRPDVYGRLAGRMKKKIVVSTLHSENQWLVESGLTSWVTKLFDTTTARLVDAFVAVAPSVKDFAVKHLGVPAEKITVINNGVDARRFSNLPSKKEIRERFHWAPDDFVVGSAGRLIDQKNPELFVEIARSVLEVVPTARFVWAGEGVLFEKVKARAKKYHIDDRCQFMGFLPNAPEFLAALDLFVLPSRYEGLSNALLEAMSLGIPPIVSCVSGNCEVIASDAEGVLVDTLEVGSFAHAIIQLHKDASRRKMIGQSAQTRVQHSFSSESVARQYEAFYERLLSEKDLA